MKFEPLKLEGSYLIQSEAQADERGLFVRTFCSREFAKCGLNDNFRQCSISFNPIKHTLRGLHFQLPPHEEAKLVRCTQGTAYHVILDLRENSESYLKWTSVELRSDNCHSLYVPAGMAHGFVTLMDSTAIFYQISEFYAPESATGVRWNDPAFSILWPVEPAVISGRDRGYSDYLIRT